VEITRVNPRLLAAEGENGADARVGRGDAPREDAGA